MKNENIKQNRDTENINAILHISRQRKQSGGKVKQALTLTILNRRNEIKPKENL